MMANQIPFNDLFAQYNTIKKEIDYVIDDVIKNSLYIRGPYVDKFEQMFAELSERNYCISCANGTDSLYIAMKALGIKPGDEVIAPAHSWISTTETITQAGGKVVFCDTDRDTFTIDPKCIEDKITSRTVGIIPVHLYGQPADMDEIMKIAKKNSLWVLEDCAQAHLARYKGKLVGTFGDAASYSFYPGKNLGAMGDAGAIVTNDAEIARFASIYARHGGRTKGEHLIEGVNSRMDGIQAAVLTVKIPYLKSWTEKRKLIANYYSKKLNGINEIWTPKCRQNSEHVWHLYVIRVEDRDALNLKLNKNGISTVISYKTALPFLDAYKRLEHKKEEFPNAYYNQSRIISIPIYPEINKEQQDYVIQTIKKCV